MCMPLGAGEEEARVASDSVAFPGLLDDGDPTVSKPINESARMSPEVLTWRRVFPGSLEQAPEARRFVRFLLDGSMFTEEAELIAGELVGNALRHTRSGQPDGHFTVEIALTST